MSDSIPRITEIRAIPLQESRRATNWTRPVTSTPWSRSTDAGFTGIGSCYTSTDLVMRRSVACATSTSARSPSSRSACMRSWSRATSGGGGAAPSPTPSAALTLPWGDLRDDPDSASPPARRLLPRQDQSLCLAEHAREPAPERPRSGRRAAFAPSSWAGGAGRTGNAADDEAIIRMAREVVGDGEIMVDPARRSNSGDSLQHGAATAMLANYGVVWFEEALPPDDLEGYKLLREHARVMISSGEVFTRRQTFEPFLHRRVGHRAARLHQGRRPHRGQAHRLDGLPPQHHDRAARLEHRCGPGGGPAPRGGAARGQVGGISPAVGGH